MHTITLLKADSTDEIMKLIARATTTLDEKGIPQWDEIYPDRKTIARDIENGTLYGLMDKDTIAGILVLNENQDREYGEVSWGFDDEKPLVLHRLCLNPDYQGRGLSKVMMSFVEDYARVNGYRSIRLDAFTLNPISLSLYRSVGFIARGEVRFRKGRFICFEKTLVSES
jgi:GNAT superfamily N-acetyltransferase